jgi:hypothetical protein
VAVLMKTSVCMVAVMVAIEIEWRFFVALIVAIDEGRGRISLSTKPLENYPGEILENFAEYSKCVMRKLKKR